MSIAQLIIPQNKSKYLPAQPKFRRKKARSVAGWVVFFYISVYTDATQLAPVDNSTKSLKAQLFSALQWAMGASQKATEL